MNNIQTVAVGDLFRDNDPRTRGARIVKVVEIEPGYAHADVVEHWDEKLIGRHTHISLDRLERGKNLQTGYTKVSH